MRKLNTDAFIDPNMIMTVIVSLIILAVGVFAFFVTIQSIPTSNNTKLKEIVNNTSSVGNSMFNIIGVVLIIGVIMTIVGLVYSYIGADLTPKRKKTKRRKPVNNLKLIEKERTKQEKMSWNDNKKETKEKPKNKKDGWQI